MTNTTNTTEKIDVIETFLNNWKEEAAKFIIARYEEFEAAMAATSKTDWQARFPLLNEYADVREYSHSGHRGGYKNAIREDVEKEAERKYNQIMAKVEKICGEITDSRYLKIAGNGELNGYLIGTTGNASVKTIMAGGHNIQCLHFRTLVKPYKK